MALTKVTTAVLEDSAVHNSKIADSAVTAAKLDVVGNGTAGEALLSDGDGTFSWGPAGESYTAGTGMTLTGTEFSIGQAVATTDIVQFAEVRSTGDVIAYYTSDERLKDNFKPLVGALDKVEKMGGYEFDWNDKQDTYEAGEHSIGVKAQEVQAEYPELVKEREDGYLAVDYVKLTAVLLESVKELSAKVTELESKIK